MRSGRVLADGGRRPLRDADELEDLLDASAGRSQNDAGGPRASGERLEDPNPGAVHERQAGYVDDDVVLVVGAAAEGPDGRLLRFQIDSLEI
jgi:hypothetical protein